MFATSPSISVVNCSSNLRVARSDSALRMDSSSSPATASTPVAPMLPATPFAVWASRCASSVSPASNACSMAEGDFPWLLTNISNRLRYSFRLPATRARPSAVSTPGIVGISRIAGLAGCVATKVPACSPRRFAPVADRLKHGLRVDRFCNVINHSGVMTTLSFFEHGVRGHCDDRQFVKASVRRFALFPPCSRPSRAFVCPSTQRHTAVECRICYLLDSNSAGELPGCSTPRRSRDCSTGRLDSLLRRRRESALPRGG